MADTQKRDASAEGGIAWDWVAQLYDSYVTTTLDVPFYLTQAAAVSGETLELMCGTGRISIPLAEAGARMTCVDASAGMLARLREKLERRPEAARNITILQADVRRLDLDRQFDLILLPFHSFSELVEEDDQRRLLANVARMLRNGGRFIAPLHNPPVRQKTLDGLPRLVGRFPLDEGQLHVWSVTSVDAEGRADGVQLYEEYDNAGTMLRKRQLPIRFALLDHERFASMTRMAGFKVVSLYGDYAYAPFQPETSPFQVWILTT